MNKTFELIFKALSEHKRVLLNDELFSGYLAWLSMILFGHFAMGSQPNSDQDPPPTLCKRRIGARRLRASVGLARGACVQALRAESTLARKRLAPSLRLQTVWGRRPLGRLKLSSTRPPTSDHFAALPPMLPRRVKCWSTWASHAKRTEAKAAFSNKALRTNYNRSRKPTTWHTISCLSVTPPVTNVARSIYC